MSAATDVIEAVCAVAAMVGGAVSWWQANKSAAAKRGAEEARRRAKALLREAARQSDALESVAAAVTPPVLQLEADTRYDGRGHGEYSLQNPSKTTPRTIVEVLNSRDFLQLDMPDLPRTLAPGESLPVRIRRTSQSKGAPNLVVSVQGLHDPITLAL